MRGGGVSVYARIVRQWLMPGVCNIRCGAQLVICRRAATADQVAIFAEKGTKLLYLTKEGPLVEVEVLSVLLVRQL